MASSELSRDRAPTAVRAALRARARALEDEELERLEQTLGGDAALTAGQRAIVEAHADRIVEGVLAPVDDALESNGTADRDVVRTVERLFDLDAN